MGVFVLHSQEPEAAPLLRQLAIPAGTEAPQDGSVVIRWGTTAADPPGSYVMNPLKAVLRCLHAPARNRILKLHGMKTEETHGRATANGGGKPSYPWEYWVPVFHLEALAVYEKKNTHPYLLMAASEQGYRRLPPASRGFHARRAAKDAVRAVYALGLDLALVKAASTVEGDTIVLEVHPCPRLNEPLARLYTDAIHRLAQQCEAEEEREHSPVLGADPEFLLRRPDGRIANARKFLEKEGAVGCDAVVMSGHRLIHPLVELRPEPAAEPLLLAANLSRNMREAQRRLTDGTLSWLSGGMPVPGIPLGGHVHLSGMMLSSRLLRALDNYAALPLLMTEGAGSVRRRPRYGYLGDFRRKHHGGFEYRSLPSWLQTPEHAAGVLCLVRCIADHYRELSAHPLDTEDGQKAFYAGDKEKLRTAVLEQWKELEQTDAYKRYARELEPLKERIAHGRGWEDDGDIRTAWLRNELGEEPKRPARVRPEKTGAARPFML